jgi:hypothetical protein
LRNFGLKQTSMRPASTLSLRGAFRQLSEY